MLALMGRRVRPKEGGIRDIIRVTGSTTGMVGRDEKVVETLSAGNYWIFRVEYFVVNPSVESERGKIFLYFGTYDPDGMGTTEVQIAPHQRGNVGCDVVGCMWGEVARCIGIPPER